MYVSSNAKNCTWPWIGKAFSASLLISGLGINMESVCAQTEQVSPVVVNRFQSMLPPSFVGPSNATQIRIAPKPVVQHVESGPIDLNNLSAEILNCEVCRQRLGLPPLNARVQTTPQPSPATQYVDRSTDPSSGVRMLGSPGLISSGTAAKMATEGLVVDEFVPPNPPQGAIQLETLPLEIRQQFLRGLDLPFGARVMSANVLDSKESKPTASESLPTARPTGPETILRIVESNTAAPAMPRSLGAPGIVVTPEPAKTSLQQETPPAAKEPTRPSVLVVEPPVAETKATVITPTVPAPTPQPYTELAKDALQSQQAQQAQQSQQAQIDQLTKANEQLQRRLLELTDLQTKRQAEIEKATAEKMKSISDSRDGIAQKLTQMDEQQRQAQIEMQQRIAQADAANKEVLLMLEKRTAEVTELQAKLRAQQEELKVKTTRSKKPNAKPDPKKSGKNTPSARDKKESKHPKKPSIDT